MIILSHKEFRSVPNMYIDVADNFICLVVSIEFCLKNLHLFRNANPIKIARINNIRITNMNIKVRVIQFWYMYSNHDRDIFKPLETFIYHLAQGPARYLCLSCTYRGTESQTL